MGIFGLRKYRGSVYYLPSEEEAATSAVVMPTNVCFAQLPADDLDVVEEMDITVNAANTVVEESSPLPNGPRPFHVLKDYTKWYASS